MSHRDILYLALYLTLVAVATSWAYRFTQSEWIDYRRGQSLYDREKYLEAIKYLERARQAGFIRPGIIQKLSDSYEHTGHTNKAKAVLRTYIDRGSSPQEVYQLAVELESRGQLNMARLAYASILARDPDQTNVRIRLARVLTWTNHLEQAVTQYRTALKEKHP